MIHAPLHVVFGGRHLAPLVAARLAVAGVRVRVVRRSGPDLRIPGVATLRADARDPGAVHAAVRGAAVVYDLTHAAHPPRAWELDLLRIRARLVEGAGRAGARLVILDDLHAYGRAGDLPISEDTPQAPCTRGGEFRARLFDGIAAAAVRGDVRAVVGRASDLFGPAAWPRSVLGERFWVPVLAGRPGTLLGDPDTAHTYHFTADVAAGLVALGLDQASDGLWMLPCAPAVSTRALVRSMAAALGREIPLRRVPPLARAVLGAAPTDAGEPDELAYQWDEPRIVDDSRFRERYGDFATPLDEAARDTVAHARMKVAEATTAAMAR